MTSWDACPFGWISACARRVGPCGLLAPIPTEHFTGEWAGPVVIMRNEELLPTSVCKEGPVTMPASKDKMRPGAHKQGSPGASESRCTYQLHQLDVEATVRRCGSPATDIVATRPVAPPNGREEAEGIKDTSGA